MENYKNVHPKLRGEYTRMVVYLMVLDVLDDEGAPESHFYMPLSQIGMTVDQFTNLISSLKNYEAIEVKNHYITKGKGYSKAIDCFNRMKTKLLNIKEQL